MTTWNKIVVITACSICFTASTYVATNSVILNFLTGIGHHNNHHIYPNRYTYKVDNEIDIPGLVIEKFFKQ